MKKLDGKYIALVGPRKAEEQSKLVQNLGGIPLVRPAQGTVFLDDSRLEESVKEIIHGEFEWILFTTGIGTETLYKAAVNMGMGDDFIQALEKMKIAARGYKTVNMLKKLGFTPLVRDDDGSTAGLIRNLAPYSLKNNKVALQLHGDPAPLLISWLNEQKALFKEILPYVHIPPEDETMDMLLSELLHGRIDAVFFTSAPQARNLMSYARKKGFDEKLLKLFSTDLIALAVGKVTAQALKEEGIERVIFPEKERMGSAIVTLTQYYQQNS